MQWGEGSTCIRAKPRGGPGREPLAGVTASPNTMGLAEPDDDTATTLNLGGGGNIEHKVAELWAGDCMG